MYKVYKSIKEKSKDKKGFVLDLEVGDTILGGKFKNKTMEVKGFKTDEKGQPVVKTNKKDVPMLKFRIKKLMPED